MSGLSSALNARNFRLAALIVLLAGLFLFGVNVLKIWTVDARGISRGAETVPERDFTNLWGGARLVLEGRIGVLFDVERYRETMRLWLVPAIPDQEWSYPPHILFLGLPLALLPLFPAYLIWTFGTLALLVVSLRAVGVPRLFALTVLLGPGVLISALYGQNGALTAALLIAGLALLDRRPILAGLCFGLLTIKPQLGLLLPVLLLAGRHYRAIASATVTALVLINAAALAFGLEAWTGFLTITRPLMVSLLEAPYPTGYQSNASTLFLSLRAMGADLTTAYAGQGLCAALCAFLVWQLWRGASGDPWLRIATTIPLFLLASPYGYNYDMAVLTVAVVLVVWRGSLGGRDWILAIAWLWPFLVNPVNRGYFPLSPLVLAGFAAYAGLQWQRSFENVTGKSPAVESPPQGNPL